MPLQGLLRKADGKTIAQDGYYDMRVVAFNPVSGQQILSQDFQDVVVKDGQYTLPVSIPKFADTGSSTFQVCHSGDPSAAEDGLDAEDIPTGCKDPVVEKKVFVEAECPQTLNISSNNFLYRLIGNRDGSISGNGCTYVDSGNNFFAQTDKQAPTVVGVQGAKGDSGSVGPQGPAGPQGEKGADGAAGVNGTNGTNGAQGPAGAQGPSGDPATDDQTLSFGGANILSIAGGNSVDLSSLKDNTDVLASLGCTAGQIAQYNGSAWACASPAASSDSQTLSLVANTLSILNGNSVSLASYLDNTDAQSISVASNVLSISGNASTVNLASYLDNTDAQTLSYSTGTHLLSISGGNTADLSSLLDNTDAQGISLAGNTLSISGNASTVNLAGYLDNTDAQSISLVGDTLSISGSAGTVSLAGYLDNTDVLAGLSCGLNQIAKWNGSAWACASDSGLTSEVDGVIGNEVTDATAGGGLTRAGLGTNVSPYTLGIAAGGVTNAMLSNSALTVSAGTGLTGGGSVSLGGTVTLSSTLGTDIDSSEIVNGTIATADIAANAITAALVSDGTLTTADLSATAGITNAQLANSSITVTAGAGLSGGGAVALGSSVTLTSTLGTAIDTTEITDGTILFADIAQNGCSNGQVLKYNTGWTCAADADTTYTAGTGIAVSGLNVISSTLGTDIDSSEIVDSTVALIDLAADSVNSSKIVNGSVANADLANSAVTITAGTGLSGGGAVTLGSSVTLNLANDFGASIDSSEITDGTVALADLANSSVNSSKIVDGSIATVDVADGAITLAKLANCSSDGQILKYTVVGGWACAADSGLTSEVDGVIGNEVTDATVSGGLTRSGSGTGVSPYTLGIAAGGVTNAMLTNSGVTVTAGTGLTGGGSVSLGGTVTLNSSLGTAIDSTEITDGTITSADLSATAGITNAQLANNAVTVTAGSGLSGGGAVALGSSVTLTSSLGTAIDTSEITDGTILFADIAQNGCSTNQVMQWNGSAWACGSLAGSQNLFETISAPGGTASVADSATDTLAFVNGAGVTITSDGTTDTITIAATLGTAIDSSEIVDGTITTSDISATAGITNAQLANSAVTVTAGTGLSGGGSVALGSSVTLSSTLGTAIDTNEITDGTIAAIDIASGAITTSKLANCSSDNQILKYTTVGGWACAADADTTYTAGTGISINGSNVISSTLGTDIDSSEIVDGTVALIDLAADSVNSSKIVDGSIANADLANSSVTVTAGTGLSGGGSVALGGTVTLNLANDFGASIDSGEITNGTITLADLAQNSCGDGQVIKWSNGSTAWVCANDIDTQLSEAQVDTYTSNNGYLTSFTEVDGSTTNELQNVFTTIAAPDANNPSADSTTDTLTLANGAGISITSNGTTDTITVAATLGATIDSSAEIVDGTIANADLANSSLTVSSGNGLTGGGSVALGATTTLNIGAGNGINVAADAVSVQTFAATDGLSTTTSSGSGIEVLASGVGLLQGCANNEILKWNETTDVWACAADNDTIISEATVESYIFDADNTGTLSSGTLALGSLSYTGTLSDTQISDTLTIGATSTVSDSALSANVSKLGSDISSAEIANGTIAAADVAPDALDFTELNDTMSLDVATSISLGANDLTFTAGGAGNVVTNLSSTGDFIVQDNGTTAFVVQDNGGVYIGDPASAIATGSLLVLDSITTAPGSPVNGAMYYDSGLAKFRCYESSTWKDCISAPGSQNDTAATYYFFSDFIGNPTTTGQDVYATNSGTGAATAASANVAANRPGIFRSTTGTTATGRTAFASNLTAFALGGGAMSYETAVNIATLSTGTERYQLVIGLFDTATAANQVDAVSFVYDEGGVSTGSAASANWQIRTASNSTRSWTTTTTAVAAATWYKLRVEVNAAGTSATFYINGTNVGTIATNIPTGTARALGFGHLMIKSVGTTARTMDIDYMKAEQSFTTSR